MKTSTFLVMGACALGLFASAFADGETASATWFAENATSVSTALSGGGSTPSGTWSNLADQVQVKENVIEVDADDEQAVAYAPTAELTANASSVTLSNVVFVAARKTLPAIEAGTQAAVAVATNEAGSCVFAVAVAGEWVVTTVSANPEEAYTIRCDFTYGGTATVSYTLVGESEETLLYGPVEYAATSKISTLELMGCGSFTAVGGVYPVATIDFGELPEGVAKATVNGNELVDGKATVPAGTRAVIEFTAEDGWSVAPKTITLDSVTENVDYKDEKFPAEPRERPWHDGHVITSDQIGVCSWTWHGSISNALEQMKFDGRYNGMQLALAPWLGIDSDTLYFGTPEGEKMWKFIKEKMASKELNVMSTMINFPGEDYTTLESITNTQGYMWGVATNAVTQADRWASNLYYTAEAARLTAELGVDTLTTESGFICIDEDLMFDRVKEICATCRVYGVDFLIESGPQHSQFMTNLLTRLNNAGFNNVGVNFDPGDTALFGPEDPVESFWTMKPWIRMVHAKDCKRIRVEGGLKGWNEDCVWGDGYVSRLDFGEGTFLDTVRALGYTGDILYERLSGDETLTENRIAEISLAMDRIIGTLTEGKGTEDNPWFVGKTVDDSVYAWTDDDARLSVAGDGEMADFAIAPWTENDVTECLVATGVTAIGANAFAGCQNLGTLVLKPMTPPALGDGNDLAGVKIYVPAGAAETYRAEWPAYADQIDEMRSERAEVTKQLYEITYRWWDANRAEAAGEKLAAIMELLNSSDGDDGYFLPYDIFNWYGDLGALDELAKWAERLPALCTSCRIGNFVGRNFDWAYDDVEECVMRVPAAEGRLASIGVASRFFPKALQDVLGVEEFLPELTMDGINEKGVAINVNVVPAGDNGETTGTNEASDERLCAGFAVRTVLDNATSAAHAVEILKSKDIYSIKGLEFHWMISDAEESYIVECVDNELVVLKANDAQPKMSNFYVSHSPFLDEYEVVSDNEELTAGEHTLHAMGIERYENVKAGLANVDSAETMFANMTNVWYKPKYLPGNERRYWSDMNGAPVPGGTKGQRFTAFDSGLEIDTARSNAFKSAQANYVAVTNYEATTGKRTIEDGYPLTNGVVHTVHTSIYDLANRTLKVCVQEVGTNVFDFALSPVWQVVTDDGNATNGFETLSAALAALQDGDTLMPAVAGDDAVSEAHPTTFDKDNLNAVPVDCPFVITNNDVTVDFRGRVLRDAVAVADEKPYLIWVKGATGVEIQNGFFFGTTWRENYELSSTDYRGFRISDGSSVSVDGCAVFIAAVENSVNVLDRSSLAFSGCWIDGQGDGAERVFHAADDSTITIKNTKGLWNPENFWGITDGVVASLPAITGEQFTLEASSLYLDNTIISNTVTHWSEGGKVATPVTFIGEPNALSMANDAFITAKDDKGVVLPKIALMWGDTSVETAEKFECSGESPEIVSDPGNLEVTEEELSGGGYRYVVKPQTFTADQIGVCSWTWHASISNILEQMEKGGYTGIQLALAPWLGIEEGSLLFGGEEGEAAWKLVKDSIEAGKLNVMSTMINFPGEDYGSLTSISNTQGYMYGVLEGGPDCPASVEHWKSNLFYTVEAAKKTQELGVKYLTTEIGFIEINPELMFERIKEICESCTVYNVTFLMESGPQTANGMSTLLKRLNDAGISNVGVNYDPGDDELFGSEGAVTSFDAMWPWIMQCHIKDCKSVRDYWNQDCPWGEGYVSSMPFSSGKDFLSHLRRLGWNGGILFEYMAGDQTLTPDRATKIQDAMLTILRSNNQDDKDPDWADSKWVRPSVMMGEDDEARVRAAMKAQGFDAESANIVATTDNAYLTLKNWAENTVTDPAANPAPEDLAKVNGAVLTSAALGSEKVLTSDDVAVTAMEVGAEGATTLTVKLGEGGYSSAAWNSELLLKTFGILGTYSLGEAFSAENVFVSDVAIDGTTGVATANVKPKPVEAAAPQTFFYKACVK